VLPGLLDKGLNVPLRNDSAGAAPFLGIGPAMNARRVNAGPGCDRFDAPALLNNIRSSIAHASILPKPQCDVNAQNAIPPAAIFLHNTAMDDLEWIKAALKKPGKTQRGLAKATGIDPTGITRLVAGRRSIKANELPAIRKYLEVPAPIEPKPEGDPMSVNNPQRAVASPNNDRVDYSPGTKSLQDQPRDLPILGYAKAGLEGFFLDQGEVQGMARRPPILMGIRTAFAVYIRDDSMKPALKPGHIAWVHPSKAYRPEENVIIELLDGQAFIKEYRRTTEKQIICYQYRPEGEVKFDKAKVKSIMLVVGSCIEE
jgi:phage repressor protein C with HTH and peptisase S24 domain